jgi:hypothetical protein
MRGVQDGNVTRKFGEITTALLDKLIISGNHILYTFVGVTEKKRSYEENAMILVDCR